MLRAAENFAVTQSNSWSFEFSPLSGARVSSYYGSVTIALSCTVFDIKRDIDLFYTVSKNTPTLASCSFDKHGLILIIFGQQHQHTFENDMHVQLSLSLHFC